ncbi:MAG: gliding motility lipoprotein GldB [Flavisolibacter sp.]
MTNTTVKSIMRLPLSSLFLLMLIACNNSNNKPNVSDIKIDLQIQRFDKDFFSMDTNRLSQSLAELNKKYPTFFPLYAEFLSPINAMVKQQGKSYDEAVKIFFRTIKPLADVAEKKYSDLDKVQAGLEKSFKYIKHYYPSFKVPAVVASVESFNPDDPQEVYGTTYYNDTLILSLQMFLGSEFGAYDPVQYPDYLRRRFNEDYIVPNSIQAIVKNIYPDSSETASLIEQMVERGKEWYLLKKFMPDAPDSQITGYTKNQIDFITKNEGNIWGEFLKSTTDPYTVDQERLKNYLGEAPFTQDMPHDLHGNGTPGNIGQWIGWRIVQKFAENNPNMSVQQILSTPAKTIFQEAKYKPK